MDMSRFLARSLVLLLLGVLPGFITDAHAQQSSALSRIDHLELREDGWNAVYLTQGIPDLGCGLQDRAILSPQGSGAAAMLQALNDSLRFAGNVVLRLEGCVPIRPASTLTAARIIKIDLYY